VSRAGPLGNLQNPFTLDCSAGVFLGNKRLLNEAEAAAELAICFGVILRKVWGGSRTGRGREHSRS
jgi:hypothetical protein